MKMLRLATATALLASGVAPASAQEAPAGPFPVMSTMDRVTDHTNFHGSLSVGLYDEDETGIDLGLRLDLGGQYVAPQGWGVYGYVPISHLQLADFAGDDSETAIGNIEAGGTFQLPAGQMDVILRGGISLPTGPDLDDVGFAVNASTIPARLAEFTSITGDITWLRLGGSLLHRQGNLFLRADGGLDLAIAEADGVDADPMVRVNLGAGVDLGTVTLSGELVTTGTTNGDADEQFFHTLAGTVAFNGAGLRPYGALVLPLDETFRDGVPFFLVGGIEIPVATR